ncbi:hypothetical protein Btru_046604 [Bulinus truncatus]|nr:hypothetical protein Btru_046604 [Bulinus truncatus]
MTFNNNVSIKQEPASPPTDTIAPHHFSGSSLIYRSDTGASAYSASPQSGTLGGNCPAAMCSLPQGAAAEEKEFKWAPETPGSSSTSPSCPKTALKTTILSRRRAKGQEDVGTLFEEPRTYQLTKADIERRERRREQNRRAAKRCRNKKKSLQSVVCQETERFKVENVNLKNQIDRLQKEVHFLKDIIDTHAKSGCCNLQEHMELPTVVQYDTPMTTTSHYGTEVTQALAGAHSALNSDLQTSCTVSVVDSGLPSLPSLDFGKFSNLPSWDLSRIDVDPLLTAAEFAEPLYTSYSHVVSNEDSVQQIHCVNPNLVQQQVSPANRSGSSTLGAAAELLSGSAFGNSGGDGEAHGHAQSLVTSTSAVNQGDRLGSTYYQLQCSELQFPASYINTGGHYNNNCEEVYGQHYEPQYYANQRH